MTDRQAAVWAEVLESLRESGQPAYVEIDPETDRIIELLLPIRYTVDHIEPVDDGLEVQLRISHARHYLRRSHPDFRAMRGTLQRALESGAPVLVTETLDTDQIIDVQPVEDRTGG